MKKQRKKQKTGLKKFKKLDEHLVVLVMFFSALLILILFALHSSSTGFAIAASGTPTPEGTIQLLNQNMFTIEDYGRMKCDFACGQLETKAIVSLVDGSPIENDVLFNGEYTCSCVGIE